MAHFIDDGESALVGVTLDGRALYDRRLLSCDATDTRDSIVLLDVFSVKSEEELLRKIGYSEKNHHSALREGVAYDPCVRA